MILSLCLHCHIPDPYVYLTPLSPSIFSLQYLFFFLFNLILLLVSCCWPTDNAQVSHGLKNSCSILSHFSFTTKEVLILLPLLLQHLTSWGMASAPTTVLIQYPPEVSNLDLFLCIMLTLLFTHSSWTLLPCFCKDGISDFFLLSL